MELIIIILLVFVSTTLIYLIYKSNSSKGSLDASDLMNFSNNLNTQIQDIRKEIDSNSLASYLKYSYVPTPNSIYRNISKLEQGTYLVFDTKTHQHNKYKYWELKSLAKKSISQKKCKYSFLFV